MSRGIDPDVADPQHCHSHPEVPDKWPSRQELRAYVAATRAAILQHGGLDNCCTDSEVMRRVCSFCSLAVSSSSVAARCFPANVIGLHSTVTKMTTKPIRLTV